MPKISVGLPVRNGGQYLAAAMHSILNQSERNMEIIVSDNGSDDGSSVFLKQQAVLDQRIRYFRQDPPIRAYDNFRFVLAQAHGEYFMWAAHDDTRDADWLARLIKALECTPEAVLAFGDLNIITPDDPIGHRMDFPFSTHGLSVAARLAKLSRMQCFYIYGLWRTAAVRHVPYAYCVWWPDLPMMLAASTLGTFVHVPDTKFHYLQLSKSSAQRAKDQDYAVKFNLLVGVVGLVGATYRACAGTAGPVVGAYAAMLVSLKQAINLPGFVYRRLWRLFAAA